MAAPDQITANELAAAVKLLNILLGVLGFIGITATTWLIKLLTGITKELSQLKTKLEVHEARTEERYSNMEERIGETRELVASIQNTHRSNRL